ncbi:MAG: hypothetical protein MUO76_00255, partial [Anaerolineaceae bacterium]|nr:hypothetical protein [Anaerolineaceae bacterium]
PTPSIIDSGQGPPAHIKDCEQYVGKIIFMSNLKDTTDGNPYEIYMMDPDGDNLVPVTQDTYFDAHPAWSPDHCPIVFTSQREKDSYEDLYVINADGTGLTHLTSDPGSERMANWSPDGKHIIYISQTDMDIDLFVMNADGSHPINLTNSPEQERDPEWSPDGNKILFVCSNPIGDYEGHGGICLIDPDGSNFTRLTPVNENNYMFPTWSPDGTQIALVTNLSGQLEIYTMKPDGSDLNQVTSFSTQWNPVFLNWSADGKKIVFEDRAGVLGDGSVFQDISILYLDDLSVVNLTNSDEVDDRAPDW